METALKGVYLLDTEAPGDYVFTPSAVVVVTESNRIHLYCASAEHNLFRAALTRFTLEELVEGVVFRDQEFRISDLTEEMARRGWNSTESIPAILRHLYTANRRHLFFLKKYAEP